MDIKVKLIPETNLNYTGYSMTPTHITIHNTGNTEPTADAKAHNQWLYDGGFLTNGQRASYHYNVDKSCVWQSLPETVGGYHAGEKAMQCSIGVEICMNSAPDFRAACIIAAELTANLMYKWKIPLANVVTHKHWTGKICPQWLLEKKHGTSWEWFINSVSDFYATIDRTIYTVQIGAFFDKNNAENFRKQAVENGYKDAFIFEKKL